MFIVAGKEVIPLYRGDDGFYRDSNGTIFALRDDSDTVDLIDRCGVGVFSLPESHPLTDACRPHEFAYSSPAYQAFHSRDEADEYLAQLVRQISGYSWLAPVFKFISRVFGGSLWEESRTK